MTQPRGHSISGTDTYGSPYRVGDHPPAQLEQRVLQGSLAQRVPGVRQVWGLLGRRVHLVRQGRPERRELESPGRRERLVRQVPWGLESPGQREWEFQGQLERRERRVLQVQESPGLQGRQVLRVLRA